MTGLALVIAVIALVLAYSAFRKSGGSANELKSKVEDLGITTENLRLKTADALNRLEKTIRGESRKVEKEEEASPEKPAEEKVVDQDTIKNSD